MRENSRVEKRQLVFGNYDGVESHGVGQLDHASAQVGQRIFARVCITFVFVDNFGKSKSVSGATKEFEQGDDEEGVDGEYEAVVGFQTFKE